jgi:hypothetical protein
MAEGCSSTLISRTETEARRLKQQLVELRRRIADDPWVGGDNVNHQLRYLAILSQNHRELQDLIDLKSCRLTTIHSKSELEMVVLEKGNWSPNDLSSMRYVCIYVKFD